jgi:hypothetical protein
VWSIDNEMRLSFLFLNMMHNYGTKVLYDFFGDSD